MKWITLKRAYAFFFINHIYVGTRFFDRKRKLLCAAGYTVGEGTRIVGPMFCSGELQIGRDCWIGRGFSVCGNGKVTIGDSCDLGPEVSFQTGGHLIGSAERRAGAGRRFSQSVGSGTWMGARSTVVGDTSIGEACVVASCACVTRNVPAHTLVGGVPAKALKELEHDDQTLFEK